MTPDLDDCSVLFSYIERLQSRIRKLEAALKVYADENNWDCAQDHSGSCHKKLCDTYHFRLTDDSDKDFSGSFIAKSALEEEA